MTYQELAAKLNGREYTKEITDAEQLEAKAAGLVVVFGASDDLVELRGAIYDEFGAYGGGDIHLHIGGLLTNKCENEECPYFALVQKKATPVKAIWDSDGYSWVYETDIPHATFDVLEDGEKYCRGIAFALSDVPAL